MNAPLAGRDVRASLASTPSLIERVWPAQKISVEAQRERKAVSGQTLTGLGGYWKGRKPLVLVRACVLGALLPSTGDDTADIALFETLMGFDDQQILSRLDTPISVADIEQYGSPAQKLALLDEKVIDGTTVRTLKRLPSGLRFEMMAAVIARMPYLDRAQRLLRPEQVEEAELTGSRLDYINERLGMQAESLAEVVEALGQRRFGRRPRVGDAFAGGGSIPFEASRLGCEAYGSDLNPIAALLSWSSLNVIGSGEEEIEGLDADLRSILAKVELEFRKLGFEIDGSGNQAKAYLYCIEVRCPTTGWLVPLLPTRVISPKQKCIVELRPNRASKSFDFVVRNGVSAKDLMAAETGTFVDQRVVYELDGETVTVPFREVRGDYRDRDGRNANRLRLWDRSDISPRPDDVLRERLYCIQWSSSAAAGGRSETFYAAPTPDDLSREHAVREYVRENLDGWMADGVVADMMIEPGEKTDEPIRTRGWTWWHHLFHPRQIALIAHVQQHVRKHANAAKLLFFIPRVLDNNSKLCRWKPSQGGGLGSPVNTFDNMALNPLLNFGVRGVMGNRSLVGGVRGNGPFADAGRIKVCPANEVTDAQDVWITDPPYADAVCYHEITEFFIAWLRKGLPEPFGNWLWDSRRPLAVKGTGEEFRVSMVGVYARLSNHMPANGLQIVMFTHQDASVWADMAQIFWGSGLQVMAAWYIATETSSELKKGGYVQGTVILVLRKRTEPESGYKDEIVQEVRAEVAEQIDTMAGLNQNLKGSGRIENLFEDADLQMAGYAAALRVLTRYTSIDGVDMTKEALRPRKKGETGVVTDIIDFAVQVANEHMVPEGMASKVWERLTGAERFYFKMMDIETTGAKKLDNYENFSKAFRIGGAYKNLMGSMKPNEARLKRSKDFKKAGFEIEEFGPSATRAVLFALHEIQAEMDGDIVLSHLKDLVPGYLTAREDIIAITDYIALKRDGVDEGEHRAAGILHGLIRNERLG